MKKAVSLLLASIMCFLLCACGETTFHGDPKTVALNDGNFWDYFSISAEIENVGIASKTNGDVVNGTMVMKITPKFKGTWSDFQVGIKWEMIGTVGITSKVDIHGYTNTINLKLPPETNGQEAEELALDGHVESLPFQSPGSIAEFYVSNGISVGVDLLGIENVSGTLAVYG